MNFLIEFLVGALVFIMFGVLAVVGMMLFPLLIVTGFFLKFVLGILLFLVFIWLIGKGTLASVEHFKKLERRPS